ncbi:MAG: thiamine phosphate synthase [Planctomycetota bacterium JB042]
MEPERLRLVCVTPGSGDVAALERLADAALDGGATAVWMRERDLEDADLERLARRVRARGGVAIVSGRAVPGAHAVHLGFRDDPPPAWRARVGPELAIGYSAHDPLDPAAVEASDYVTLSPLFPTPKASAAPEPCGVERFAALARTIGRPVVALGGIDASNAALAIDAGAVGVAVLRAIAAADDPRAAAAALRRAVDEALR